MMYRVNVTHDAPTDVRLLAPFYLDDEWAEIFTARVLDEGHVPHNIQPSDVEYVVEDDEKFFIEIDTPETKHHQAIANAIPMIIINSSIFETDSMAEGEAIGAMLLDSGMSPAEIDHIMGSPENWRTTDTISTNYGVLQ